jgi:hypothetical protein
MNKKSGGGEGRENLPRDVHMCLNLFFHVLRIIFSFSLLSIPYLPQMIWYIKKKIWQNYSLISKESGQHLQK